MFFEGFGEPEVIMVGGEPIRLRRAGVGPAVLLLHGHPQTHAMWHAVAPILMRAGFSVLCPDLTGYGGSRAAAGTNALAGTKDAMAQRMVALLDQLGVGPVAVVGHDRGGRVAHRLAVGWPERVTHLGLLDLVPTPDAAEREDMAFALATYRMFWFAQTHPKPEALFHEEPKIWLPGTLPGAEAEGHFHHEAIADYLAGIADTEAMADMNEEYRRAVARDVVEDRMGRQDLLRFACPALVLWGALGRIGGWYDPVALWQERADGTVSGLEVAAGHFLAEEQPAVVADALIRFLRQPRSMAALN
jgi:haloacetate dehalogenase